MPVPGVLPLLPVADAPALKPQVRYERQGEANRDSAQANLQKEQKGEPLAAAADQERLTRERLGIGQPLVLLLTRPTLVPVAWTAVTKCG